jgi:hypothetical protein
MDDNSGFLTLLMNIGGPIVLGIAIAYLVWRSRRTDWRGREQTEKATEDLYRREERKRQKNE